MLEASLPFPLRDGWPDPLPGLAVVDQEAGCGLGELLLAASDWSALRSTQVWTARLDEHPPVNREAREAPDADGTPVESPVPAHPVVAPPEVLQDALTFRDWVTETHGARGRLLMWDSTRTWWMLNDPDVETQLICAPPGTFANEEPFEEPFGWLPPVILTDYGRNKIELLSSRYGLPTS